MTYRASIVPLRDVKKAVYLEFMDRKHFTSSDWKQLMSVVLSLAGESIDYDRMSITVENVDTGAFCFAFYAYTRVVDGRGLHDSRLICDVYACGRFNHIRGVVLAE